MWQQLLSKLRSFVLWHRRILAAVSAGICVLTLGYTLAPPPPPSVKVVGVKSPVPAGAIITPDALTTLSLPEDAVPPNALTDPRETAGKIAIVELSERTVVTKANLLGGQPPPAGMRHIPIRLADTDLMHVLRAGDRVTVFGIGREGTTKQLTSSVRVVAIPSLGGNTSMMNNDTRNSLIILEIPNSAAAAVISASLQQGVSVVMG